MIRHAPIPMRATAGQSVPASIQTAAQDPRVLLAIADFTARRLRGRIRALRRWVWALAILNLLLFGGLAWPT